MWQYFEWYVEDTKANPFIVEDWVGKDADKVERKKEKPLTMVGFENYLARLKIITDISDYVENKDGFYDDFIHVCRRIRSVIKQDQIEGGMAMIYHHGITARLNGLVEKTETDMKVTDYKVSLKL